MNDLKIIVCSTFRDFEGTENDDIQKMFLKSIEGQTYNNIEFVVTLFGEKNVQKEVEKFNFNSFFYNSEVENIYRYSLTKVILNTINHANKQKDNYLILWTTCDVIYESNFFETIIKNYQNNLIGTSHPHTTYSSIVDFDKGVDNKNGRLYSGFDLIYFDRCFLAEKKINNCLKDYIFNDWGVFEHFLISLNELNQNSHMVNIYEESKIYKIENDRTLTNEPNQFLMNSHKLNSVIFNRFFYENKITNKYFDLTYCHCKFKITSNHINHFVIFKKDIFEYFQRMLRLTISSLVSQKLKNLLKGKK